MSNENRIIEIQDLPEISLLTEKITLENYKPDPDDIDTVTIFTVSQEEAKAFGAVDATNEELKEIGIEED